MPWVMHRIERKLFILTLVFLWLGILSLFEAQAIKNIRLTVLLSLFVSIAFLVVHLVLEGFKLKGDKILFPLTSMLSVIGLLMVMRLSPEFAVRQFIWLFAGLFGYLLTLRGLKNYKDLEDYKYIYIFGGIFLLLVTIVFGSQVGGARSWLNLGPLKFQPSEPVKIILVIFLASYLEEKRELLAAGTRSYFGFPIPGLQYIGPLLVMWGFSLILLIFQRDLGAALIYFTTFLSMIYIATGRWSYVVIGTFLFGIGAVLCYFLFPHVQVRVAVWLNPWANIDGKGYQIVQSLFAIGSGGMYGTGLGLGRPTLIPAVHTDFVFSAWSEEMGLMGAAALLVIYGLILYRGFKISLRAKTGFGSLLAFGLTSLLAFQTLVIIGGVINLFPMTGVTLPFVSYGGSSLVSSYILLGLLTNISAKDGT